MITNELHKIWKSEKFPNSWIVEGKDAKRTYQQILKFLQKEIDKDILFSPDFFVIKQDNRYSSKNITIDQIRDLQQWIFKKSMTYKFAIIYEAELMNNNAANCCLKTLEDTPKNSYIFLLTLNSYKLLLTIRSRCRVLRSNDNTNYNEKNYESLIEAIIKKDVLLISTKLKNSPEAWENFQDSVILFLNKWLKFQCHSISLSKTEKDAILTLPKYKIGYLIIKIEKLITILRNAYIYNLDYPHIATLIF